MGGEWGIAQEIERMWIPGGSVPELRDLAQHSEAKTFSFPT